VRHDIPFRTAPKNALGSFSDANLRLAGPYSSLSTALCMSSTVAHAVHRCQSAVGRSNSTNL
ncbi:hypothetical protein HAX54_044764, partial [Datura stramonium]|nr:hypothetical protein [Datura stramonium]